MQRVSGMQKVPEWRSILAWKDGNAQLWHGICAGTNAEYIAASEKHLALIPQGVSFEQAAAVSCVAATAWQASASTCDELLQNIASLHAVEGQLSVLQADLGRRLETGHLHQPIGQAHVFRVGQKIGSGGCRCLYTCRERVL